MRGRCSIPWGEGSGLFSKLCPLPFASTGAPAALYEQYKQRQCHVGGGPHHALCQGGRMNGFTWSPVEAASCRAPYDRGEGQGQRIVRGRGSR